MSASVNGKVTHMELIDNSVGVFFERYRLIELPAVGLRVREVEYHSPLSVYPRSNSVDVDSFKLLAVYVYLIGVINAVKVVADNGRPNTAFAFHIYDSYR